VSENAPRVRDQVSNQRAGHVQPHHDTNQKREPRLPHSPGFGVCATLIGLVKLAETKHGSSHVDEYAAMAAVTFLASALTSYLSIRYSNRMELSFQIERIADVIFLGGLIGITLVATLFAYEVI
jgi:hypothetical protein